MPAGLSAPARASLPAAGKRSPLPPWRGGHLAPPAAKTRACRAGRRSGGRGQALGAILQPPCSGSPSPDGRRAPAPPALQESAAVALTLPAPSICRVLRGLRGAGRQSPAPAGRAETGLSPPIPQQTPGSGSSASGCASWHPEGSRTAGAFPPHVWVIAAASPRCERQAAGEAGCSGRVFALGRQEDQASSRHGSPFSKGFLGGLASLFGARQPLWGSPAFLPHTRALCPTAPQQPHGRSTAAVPSAAPLGGSSPPPPDLAADLVRKAQRQPHPTPMGSGTRLAREGQAGREHCSLNHMGRPRRTDSLAAGSFLPRGAAAA